MDDTAGTGANGGTIVALVDEQGDLGYVLNAAIEMAADTPGTRLILFDASGASSPPGHQGQAGASLYSPEDLEQSGRTTIAQQVRDARAKGIDAWASLLPVPGLEPMMEFARSCDADVVLLPENLGDPIILERLRGDTPVDAEVSATTSILVVPKHPPQV
jgi:hypothetical protein